MLRSNPSVRADTRAWAAILVSLLILTLHARAIKATNLLDPTIRITNPGNTLVAICQDLPGSKFSSHKYPGGRSLALAPPLPYGPPPATSILDT